MTKTNLELISGVEKKWQMTINPFGSPVNLTSGTATFRAGYAPGITPEITCDESDGIDINGFLPAGRVDLTISAGKSGAVAPHRWPVPLDWNLEIATSGGDQYVVGSGTLWIHPRV